jgi:hypothetical protein
MNCFNHLADGPVRRYLAFFLFCSAVAQLRLARCRFDNHVKSIYDIFYGIRWIRDIEARFVASLRPLRLSMLTL